MAPAASPLREKALKAWIKSGKLKRLVDIANDLGISPGLVRKWKHEFNWDAVPIKQPRGAPKGNKNAIGNSGGSGAPPENQFAVTHGLYAKYIPEELSNLISELEDKDPLEMLWDMAMFLYAKMVRSMNITFVKDKDDITKVLVKQMRGDKSDSDEWEIQHAHDKVNADLKAFASANREFRSAVKQFLSAAPEDDERRAKALTYSLQAEKLRVEIDIIKKDIKDPTKKAPTKLTEAELDAEIARLSANANGLRGKTKALRSASGEGEAQG